MKSCERTLHELTDLSHNKTDIDHAYKVAMETFLREDSQDVGVDVPSSLFRSCRVARP